MAKEVTIYEGLKEALEEAIAHERGADVDLRVTECKNALEQATVAYFESLPDDVVKAETEETRAFADAAIRVITWDEP